MRFSVERKRVRVRDETEGREQQKSKKSGSKLFSAFIEISKFKTNSNKFVIIVILIYYSINNSNNIDPR